MQPIYDALITGTSTMAALGILLLGLCYATRCMPWGQNRKKGRRG